MTFSVVAHVNQRVTDLPVGVVWTRLVAPPSQAIRRDYSPNVGDDAVRAGKGWPCPLGREALSGAYPCETFGRHQPGRTGGRGAARNFSSRKHVQAERRRATAIVPDTTESRESCELFEQTDVPVVEIAHGVGISSKQVLARVFLKHMRLSPSDYRRERRAPRRPRSHAGNRNRPARHRP